MIDLTLREREFLKTFLQCSTITECAQVLRISRYTVEFHLKNIKIKLGCETDRQLQEAVARGRYLQGE